MNSSTSYYFNQRKGERMKQEQVILELRALNRLIRKYFESLPNKKEIDNVTSNNGWIIVYLAENADKDIYQKDIEEHFSIARSTVSKVLGLMEQKGLITREAVSSDARLKKIRLTEKAVGIQKIMEEDKRTLDRALTKGFDERELAEFLAYLQRMKENIIQLKENDKG